jgi:putative Holliday junction resolvase
VGTKTIGVALCDAGWTIASPAETVARRKFSVDLAALRSLFVAQRVEGVIVGLPLNLDGSDSRRTQSVRAFARNLAPLDLPILLWDERWSTQAVTRTLLAADASRARRAELVDKVAAAYILQGAIDALAGAH